MNASEPKHAMVVGAGLAGAATCVALARRGWRVTLIDAASGPAQAASALPVGMLSPHVTRAPTPLSRLSALGVADTRRELERLIAPGNGWQSCEVDNLGHDRGRWPAALVRPGALVQAWLREARALGNVQTRWNTAVARIEIGHARIVGWRVLNRQGELVAEAPVLVIAAAHGSRGLLLPLAPDADAAGLPLRPVQGQMSLAELTSAPLAERPQRQAGVFVPCYEDRGLAPAWPARIWAMGSTYARGQDSTKLSESAHQDNARSLAAMLPKAAASLQTALASGTLLGWAGVRCASLDRLPLVGAAPDLLGMQTWMRNAGARRGRLPLAEVPRAPGLYLLTALGSRGLSLAHWCAGLLARQIDCAPLEVEPDLVRALDPARFAWKLARRQAD